MKTCPHCGQQSPAAGPRCPRCGGYYSKVIELIDQEAMAEEMAGWRGPWLRIRAAPDRRRAVARELRRLAAQLPPRAKFTLFVIFAFVFALVFGF